MKVKKHIGEIINKFKIIDTYPVILPSGNKTRKVLLKCERCGRTFERNSGVDFEHIKCRCMCAPPSRPKYRFIEWDGGKYTLTAFCNMHEINIGTFTSRIRNGMTVEEAIQKEFSGTCVICGKQFTAPRQGNKYCGKTCRNRGCHGRGEYKKAKQYICVVCGGTFESISAKAKTCSVQCRRSFARIDRNRRYKKIKAAGRFDESVTLKNVYDAYNGVCQICGQLLDFSCSCLADNYPSIDHIQPLSKGGAHEWDNVQLLCRRCNYQKGAKMMA